jgi:hypothetical protein
MKQYLCILPILFFTLAQGQTKTKRPFKIPRAKMHYVGELPADLLPVGKPWRFEQHCDTSIETVIQEGSIIFENSRMFGIKCFHEFTLRGGIAVQQVMEVEGTKRIMPFIDSLKKNILFKNPEFARLKKGGFILNENISYEDGRIVQYTLTKSKDRLIVVISDTKPHANAQSARKP